MPMAARAQPRTGVREAFDGHACRTPGRLTPVLQRRFECLTLKIQGRVTWIRSDHEFGQPAVWPLALPGRWSIPVCLAWGAGSASHPAPDRRPVRRRPTRPSWRADGRGSSRSVGPLIGPPPSVPQRRSAATLLPRRYPGPFGKWRESRTRTMGHQCATRSRRAASPHFSRRS